MGHTCCFGKQCNMCIFPQIWIWWISVFDHSQNRTFLFEVMGIKTINDTPPPTFILMTSNRALHFYPTTNIQHTQKPFSLSSSVCHKETGRTTLDLPKRQNTSYWTFRVDRLTEGLRPSHCELLLRCFWASPAHSEVFHFVAQKHPVK